MARQAHPWFRRSDGWWYVQLGGKQKKLVRGRKNKDAAADRWHELMNELASNPSPDSRNHSVASIIGLYLTHSKRSYSANGPMKQGEEAMACARRRPCGATTACGCAILWARPE